MLVNEIYGKLNDKVYNNGVKIYPSESGLSFFENIEYDLTESLEKFDYYEIQEYSKRIINTSSFQPTPGLCS